MHPSPTETPGERHRFHAIAVACLVLAAASLVWTVFQEGWGALGRLSAVGASAQIVGKWLIFVGAKAENPYGFGPWALSYAIFVLDLLIGLILNSFLPQLERIPRFGPWLIRTRFKAGDAFEEYPKLKRMAFWGVALWVFLPLPASGAVTGSFISRLIGLSRTGALGAIAVGSAANGAIFAAMASALGANSEQLLHNWPVTVISALVLLVLVWWGWRRLVKMLREH